MGVSAQGDNPLEPPDLGLRPLGPTALKLIGQLSAAAGG
jgi:hypothetical protein